MRRRVRGLDREWCLVNINRKLFREGDLVYFSRFKVGGNIDGI